MRASLSARSRRNVFLNILPVLAVELQRLKESEMFAEGPTTVLAWRACIGL